jgi:hypothetical protein
MRKILLIIGLITGLVFILSGCEKKVYVVEPDTTPPSSPKGVYCVTGDKAVYIYWERNDEPDFYKYKIYWAPETDGIIPEPDSDFKYMTSITNERYTDTDVENGTTYYYVITAVDNSGNESEPSKILYDTPRPEGQNLILYDRAIDPEYAGIYFYSPQGARVVSWDSPLCDIYLDKSSGIFYFNTTLKDSTWNDIQDFGYTDNLTDIDVAPFEGWSELGYVEVILGHTYIIWTWDYHFAKLRVTNIYSNSIRLEWAYQTDVDNPELKVLPKRIANKK